MKKHILGNTGIKLSEVGYGAAALFGKDVIGKPGVTENRAYELIATAIKHGVSFFDTGINYGYAEERLGRCLSAAIGGVLQDVKIWLLRPNAARQLTLMELMDR